MTAKTVQTFNGSIVQRQTGPVGESHLYVASPAIELELMSLSLNG